MDAIILGPGAGRALAVGPVQVSVKEDGAHTRGTMAAAEFAIPPRAPSPPPHVHHAHEEGFYILEGEIEFAVGGETVRVGAGGWVLAPIGVPHTFRNPGDAPARFLNTFTPDRYIRYFDELAALTDASGPPTPVQTAGIMARYDTEVVADTAQR